MRFDIFRNSNPRLFAVGPYMHVRLQGAGIVQGAGFNRHISLAPLGLVVNSRAALRTECAELRPAGGGFRGVGFQFALGEPEVLFLDDQGHAKGAAGLPLAIHTVADANLFGGAR